MPKTKMIDGKALSQKIREELKIKVATFPSAPCLAVVLVGDNPASQIYVRHKIKAAEEVGIKVNLYALAPVLTEDALIDFIRNLNDNDDIANIVLMNDENVLVATKNGMSIYFETKNIAPIGRITAGVKAINCAADDEVITGLPIASNEEMVAIISNKGYGKKIPIKEFTLQNRGGKGIIIYKSSELFGSIAGITVIKDTDKVFIAGNPNSICVSAADFPLLNRLAYGNIIVKSNISSIVKI